MTFENISTIFTLFTLCIFKLTPFICNILKATFNSSHCLNECSFVLMLVIAMQYLGVWRSGVPHLWKQITYNFLKI
jgi:hypothetical protein